MNQVKFGNNQFCGPSVLSAVAGITTDEAERVIQIITKSNRKVTGVYTSDLKKAFHQLGYETLDQNNLAGMSVFVSFFYLKGKDGTYIYNVPGHFIAIEINGAHSYICDNHTKSPINASSSARLNQKVVGCFKVSKGV